MNNTVSDTWSVIWSCSVNTVQHTVLPTDIFLCAVNDRVTLSVSLVMDASLHKLKKSFESMRL